MCFKIDESAPRPTSSEVFKVLAEDMDGRLYSPHIYSRMKKPSTSLSRHWQAIVKRLSHRDIEWRQNEWQQVYGRNDDFLAPNEPWPSGSNRSGKGIYVWDSATAAYLDITEAAVARYEFDMPFLVVVRCHASPVDWLYSAADNSIFAGARSYRAVLPGKVIRRFEYVTVDGESRYVESFKGMVP